MRIEILKYLSDTYGYKPLGAFLKEKFSGAPISEVTATIHEMTGAEPYSGAIDFLDENEHRLLNKNFYYHNTSAISTYQKGLPGQPDQYVKMESYRNDPIEGLGTFENLALDARITEIGRKELREYELQNSIRTVNNSVVRTNRNTIVIASLAAVFSFASLIVSVLKSDTTQVPQLQELNRIVQSQSQVIDSFLQHRWEFHRDSSTKK